VVLEVESSEQCESGLGAEAEMQWKGERRAALSRCANLKHVFQRTARDCPDVTFLTLEARRLPGPCLLNARPHPTWRKPDLAPETTACMPVTTWACKELELASLPGPGMQSRGCVCMKGC
jgi:hypothetical protein